LLRIGGWTAGQRRNAAKSLVGCDKNRYTPHSLEIESHG
jgi:hypothetical protein